MTDNKSKLRIEFFVSEAFYAEIKQAAVFRGISVPEHCRRGMRLLDALLTEESKGAKLFVQSKDGSLARFMVP